jgi:hypothetical protein
MRCASRANLELTRAGDPSSVLLVINASRALGTVLTSIAGILILQYRFKSQRHNPLFLLLNPSSWTSSASSRDAYRTSGSTMAGGARKGLNIAVRWLRFNFRCWSFPPSLPCFISQSCTRLRPYLPWRFSSFSHASSCVFAAPGGVV